MTENAETLRTELARVITVEYLQKITVAVIDIFKKKDSDTLEKHAGIIGIETKGTGINKLFAVLIQLYHPDKLAKIRSDMDRYFAEDNVDALSELKKKYIFPKEILFGRTENRGTVNADSIKKSPASYEDSNDDFEYEETYASEEFDTPSDDSWFSDDNMDDVSDERIFDPEKNFTEAVNSYFFGNQDYTVSVSDLQNLDGELDLSDKDIYSLKGVEYCVNLTCLNLSGNHIDRIDRITYLVRLTSLFISENKIESISALSSLADLEELDLSYNNIEDISVLLTLPKLLYVNIMNNPIRDKTVINALVHGGVVVVF